MRKYLVRRVSEAALHTMFQQENAWNDVIQQPFKYMEYFEDTEMKSVATLSPGALSSSSKIEVNYVNPIVTGDDFEDHFQNTTIESNNSSASVSREITLEFFDPRNEAKYDRLVREVKIVTPFKRQISGNSCLSSPIVNVYEDAASITNIENHEVESARTGQTNLLVTSRSNNNQRHRCIQELETCPVVLARRQKQIDYGKNTIGYDNYIKLIPRHKRSRDHPWTPPKQFKYSRRAFDGLVRKWRSKLHCFDSPDTNGTIDNCSD